MDFNAEIYGEILQIEFVEKLRDERIFPSADALVEQIRKDVLKARDVLERAPSHSPDIR